MVAFETGGIFFMLVWPTNMSIKGRVSPKDVASPANAENKAKGQIFAYMLRCKNY